MKAHILDLDVILRKRRTLTGVLGLSRAVLGRIRNFLWGLFIPVDDVFFFCVAVLVCV